MTALPSALKDKYSVPSPSDMLNRSPHQRLYVLTSKNLTQLKMRTDVNLENADEIINAVSNATLMTVCIDDLTLSNLTNDPTMYPIYSFVPNTPDASSMQEYELKTLGLSVFAGPLTHAEIKTHHPVSVSLIHPIVRPRSIKEVEINHLENAVGSRGSYPIRSIANVQGSVSFF